MNKEIKLTSSLGLFFATFEAFCRKTFNEPFKLKSFDPQREVIWLYVKVGKKTKNIVFNRATQEFKLHS